METARLQVREHDGAVELIITPSLGDEPTVIVIDGGTARKLGDDMYRAGCNTGL